MFSILTLYCNFFPHTYTYRSLQSVLSNFELLWEIIITNEVTCISPGLSNIHYLLNTVIVEIFGGFNFGHFRISPEFLISGGI